MKSLFLALAVTGLLSACSSTYRTPEYECSLDDVKGAKCASMEDAYKASRSMSRGDATRVQSVFDRRVSPEAGKSAPMFNGQLSSYPEPSQQGAPVFEQPKVLRVWVAPYVDADGNLRGGEYTYFSTPGRWNYGTLNKPGEASGIFAPAKPGNLGFNPVQTNKPAGSAAPAAQSRPSAPPEVQSAAQNAQAQGAGGRSPTESSGGITQPYQRLTN